MTKVAILTINMKKVDETIYHLSTKYLYNSEGYFNEFRNTLLEASKNNCEFNIIPDKKDCFMINKDIELQNPKETYKAIIKKGDIHTEIILQKYEQSYVWDYDYDDFF